MQCLFIHNPKVAGNTIKNILHLNIDISVHIIPVYLIHPDVWEKYFTIVAVRHPVDRLISSYCYHTNKTYKGFYYKKYPFIHKLSLQEYFELFKKEPFAIRPQIDYLKHHQSNIPVDFIYTSFPV